MENWPKINEQKANPYHSHPVSYTHLDVYKRQGGIHMVDLTRQFNISQEKDQEIKQIMTTVYQALEEKGYNPINQIVGYILSEDPTYITNHNHARTLIRKIDRDELLQVLVKSYLRT